VSVLTVFARDCAVLLDDSEWEMGRMLMEVEFLGTVVAFFWMDRENLWENLCQKILCPNWESNWAPQEHKAEKFQIDPAYLSWYLLQLSEYSTQFVICLIVKYKSSIRNNFCVWSDINFVRLSSGPSLNVPLAKMLVIVVMLCIFHKIVGIFLDTFLSFSFDNEQIFTPFPKLRWRQFWNK
jgi:hypothetical protein